MKLHIFGASGCGVTTLGNALAKQLNIPYFDSDDFFWEKTNVPYTVKTDVIKRNQTIKTLLTNTNNWIFGGSMINWDQSIFPAFDLVVFLWLPADIRMDRVCQREFERYGDSIKSDPVRKKQCDDFLEWAADYDNNTGISRRTLQAHEAWLTTVTAPVLRLPGDKTTTVQIQSVIDKLNTLHIKSVQ